jgi:hypothetical protein
MELLSLDRTDKTMQRILQVVTLLHGKHYKR